MRVLYLTMNPNRGSTTVPTEGWFRFLPPRGLEPVLVSHQAGAFHAWAVEQGIPAYQVPLPFPSKVRAWPFVSALATLWRLVRRHGIELIHCNEQNVYPIGQYLARLCRLPVVVSIHCSMNRAFCTWAFGGRRQPRRIFFVSRGNLEACRPAVSGLIPESSWRVLHNGLDLELVRPDLALRNAFRQERGLGTAPLIGAACPLRPVKQLEHFFEATAQLHVPGLRVLLAGKAVAGEEGYAEQLLERGHRLLGERLLYLGHLNGLQGFLNALDLYLTTSREEACSISILEALACGCPVVGYSSGSVDEQILPGGGEIVPQDDPAQLAQALADWLADPARLSGARLGARRRAEEAFDMRRLAGQLWNEYEELRSAMPPTGRLPAGATV